MNRFLLSVLLLISSNAFGATTYYIRPDGGDTAHCNGKTNVAYSPTTTPNCAWHALFDALPPNRDGNDVGRKPAIAGGDTLNIAAGSYQVGMPFGSGIYGSCSTSWQWDCHPMPIPSGTAAQPTQIIGAGSASTTFWGSGGASFVLNLSGSSNVVIQGITVTDHSNCIQNHTDATVKCQAGGLWAATGISDTEGGTDTPQSSNVTLNDVVIRSMAKFGLLAGNINNWTITNSKIIANGFGGWSLDTGKSFSRGKNTITNIEIGWNGCTENYPSTTIYACWGQMSGGYGDGFGSSSSSDQGIWNFSNVQVHDNTQDGLDFLHADPSAVITFDHVNAYRNAGNQLKGNGSVSITNSVVNGFCSAFSGSGDMQGNNSGGGSTAGDLCRALGDAIVLGQSAGHTTTIANSTVISQGNCLITVPDSGVGDATSKLIIQDNILIGQPVWVDGNQNPPPQSCLYYWNSTNTPTLTNNLVYNVKGNVGTDPKLANETLANFDPTPLPGSPALGKATNGGNIGAIQSGVPTPPQIACSGGIVSAGACYCPAGTTLNAGVCGAIPKVCTPTPILSTSGLTTTCSATCQ